MATFLPAPHFPLLACYVCRSLHCFLYWSCPGEQWRGCAIIHNAPSHVQNRHFSCFWGSKSFFHSVYQLGSCSSSVFAEFLNANNSAGHCCWGCGLRERLRGEMNWHSSDYHVKIISRRLEQQVSVKLMVEGSTHHGGERDEGQKNHECSCKAVPVRVSPDIQIFSWVLVVLADCKQGMRYQYCDFFSTSGNLISSLY